jgi:hypothetical protein
MAIRIWNNRRQPVELHIAERVTVLPPMASIECEEKLTAHPQVRYLVERNLLTVQRIAPPPEPPPAPVKRARKKTTKKAAGRKRPKGNQR